MKGRVLSVVFTVKHLPMIKNLAVVGFDNFAVGVVNQYISAAHIGPVGSCVGRWQIALLPLLNIVLVGAVQLRNGIARFEMGKVGNKAAQFVLINPRCGGCGPDCAGCQQQCAH